MSVIFDLINRFVRRLKFSPSENEIENYLDYSYEMQRDTLQHRKQRLQDLLTQKKRLQLQKQRYKESIQQEEENAIKAVENNRDENARQAIESRQQASDVINKIDEHITSHRKRIKEVQRRIEEFRTVKEQRKIENPAQDSFIINRISDLESNSERDSIRTAIKRAKELKERDLSEVVINADEIESNLSTEEVDRILSDIFVEREIEYSSIIEGEPSTNIEIGNYRPELQEYETTTEEIEEELTRMKEKSANRER